jgi:beta-galactosidase/beta-glucuronidase
MTTFRSSTELAEQRGYPRPQLVRGEWLPLNGAWEFSLDPEGSWRLPADVPFERRIRVPFAPETPASGIGDTGFYRACWYRREVAVSRPENGERVLLHFGAVDYSATVWINGALVGRHEGGYTPFTFDITDALVDGPVQHVVVRAHDDPHDLAKPRGKQDWQLEPHSIWYPRTTGIWQTVWIERVPTTWIRKLRWTPNLERWEIGLEASICGSARERLRLRVKLRVGDLLIADDTYTVIAGEVHRRIALSDPGIDDSRNELLWSPHAPRLIEAELELWGDRGERLDAVTSYTALRAVAVQGDRFVLNGRPFNLRMVLDQGYWPETGLSAPDDEALRKDVELARAMGFNGVRKHQKIEDPRYLYWADRVGLLVWEEMPSAYRFTPRSIARVTREWTAVMDRDSSHPCIIAWVPINESWGVPNLPDNPAERHYVRGLYHLTKTLDSTRPVIGNDGWESVATDIIGIHDYDSSPERIARRYHAEDELPRLFRRERPGGRVLVLEGQTHADQPIVLSEFGGICFAQQPEGVWGYSRTHSAQAFAQQYTDLLAAVRSLNILTGFCYTQFADTYQEANGLLYADRTPKFPLEQMATATRGTREERTPEPTPTP